MTTWPAIDRAARNRLCRAAMQALKLERRAAIAGVLADYAITGQPPPRGWQARLSRLYGVSRATVCLEAKRLLAEAQARAT